MNRLVAVTRKCCFVLALLIGLPATAATFAGFGGSAWWGLDLLANFRLHYSVILAAAVVLTLIAGKNLWALVIAAPLLVNVFLLGSLYLPNRPTLDPPNGFNRLKLLHFNVYSSNNSHDQVISYLDNSDAHIIFLQEINDPWLADLKQKLNHYYVHTAQPRDDNFGIAMLVARDLGDWLKITSTRTFDVTGDFVGVPAIEAVLNWNNQELALLSLHTMPPIDRRRTRLRDAQLASTAWWVQQQTRPVVLIGDLNATPWSVAYREMLNECVLVDSLPGRGMQGSYPAQNPLPFNLPSQALHAMRIPIDHCLHSPDLVTVSRRLGPPLGSDHLPLSVVLTWNHTQAPPTFAEQHDSGLSPWLP